MNYIELLGMLGDYTCEAHDRHMLTEGRDGAHTVNICYPDVGSSV